MLGTLSTTLWHTAANAFKYAGRGETWINKHRWMCPCLRMLYMYLLEWHSIKANVCICPFTNILHTKFYMILLSRICQWMNWSNNNKNPVSIAFYNGNIIARQKLQHQFTDKQHHSSASSNKWIIVQYSVQRLKGIMIGSLNCDKQNFYHFTYLYRCDGHRPMQK